MESRGDNGSEETTGQNAEFAGLPDIRRLDLRPARPLARGPPQPQNTKQVPAQHAIRGPGPWSARQGRPLPRPLAPARPALSTIRTNLQTDKPKAVSEVAQPSTSVRPLAGRPQTNAAQPLSNASVGRPGHSLAPPALQQLPGNSQAGTLPRPAVPQAQHHVQQMRPGGGPPVSGLRAPPSLAARPLLRPGMNGQSMPQASRPQVGRPAGVGQQSQGLPRGGPGPALRPVQPGVPTFEPSGTPGVLRSGSMGKQADYGLQTQRSFGRMGGGGPRIDPEAMPRPKPPPEDIREFCTRVDNKPAIPYPADYPVIVRDTGNASPRVMRMTLHVVPASTELLNSSCMPFAVLTQPLAPTASSEEPLQVVDMGRDGPLRCARCRAYVNPFFRWIELGRKFICNFCGLENLCPADYQEAVGTDGRRRDADDRPELCRGSVEFVATPDMQVRVPMRPTHFFLIDVSHTAVTTGVTAVACSAIGQVLSSIQGYSRAEIGIATFDSTIHFYSLRSSQGQAKMMVIPDCQAPYCPPAEAVLTSLKESQEPLEALLEQIPRMFAGTQAMDACATAAIEACVDALQESMGGKLHVFLSSLPKVGSKNLVMREHHGPVNGSQPLNIMTPATKEYRELAEHAANNMISVDLFCMAQQYVDVATLSMLTEITCGQLYLYQPFDEAIHGDEFVNDLKWNIVRPQGWEAVGRIRVSEGLVVERYYGPHYRRSLTDLSFPAISADSSLGIELRHKDKLVDNREAYLQFALLFTDSEGNRRVRVHTLGLKVTMVMSTIFRAADLDAQVNFMARSLAYQVPGGKLDSIKKQAMESAVDALHAYRLKCATASSSGQLILPESLKLLPLYTMSLTKSPAFRKDARSDQRAAWLLRLKSLLPARTLPLLYPRLFALGSLLRNLPLENGVVQLPLPLPDPIIFLSASKLADDGVFLLENGFEAYIHFGDRVEPDFLLSVIGAPTLKSISNGSFQLLALPEFDSAPSRALHALVDQIRVQRGRFLPVQVVPHVPPDKSPFFRSLIEDMLDDVSYVDCLCEVHRAIQRRF